MSLFDYHRIDFQLHYHLQYSREDIESMLPYERDLLIAFYNDQKKREQSKEQEETNRLEQDMRNKTPTMPSMPKMPSMPR